MGRSHQGQGGYQGSNAGHLTNEYRLGSWVFPLVRVSISPQHSPVNAYTSLEALLHDAFWAEEGEPAELQLLDETLREYPGPSLEIGCGSGRLLLPLLQKGHQVEG